MVQVCLSLALQLQITLHDVFCEEGYRSFNRALWEYVSFGKITQIIQWKLMKSLLPLKHKMPILTKISCDNYICNNAAYKHDIYIYLNASQYENTLLSFYPIFMSQIVLYILHITLVFSFYIDVVLTLSIIRIIYGPITITQNLDENRIQHT